MRKALVLFCVSGIVAGSAAADPANLAGGAFIAHHPTGMQFSSEPPAGGWCQEFLEYHSLDSCAEQVNRIDATQETIWFVLAAWEESKEWRGVEFGLGPYSPGDYVITHHGPCFPASGLAYPTENWPGPDEGIALVVTDSSWNGNLVPVYYFAGYAYGPATIALAENPATGFGGTADCGNPSEDWAAGSFGAMGFFEDGRSACPPSSGGTDERYEDDLIEVMFVPESRVRIRQGVLVDLQTNALEGVDSVLSVLTWHEWYRFWEPTEEEVDALYENGAARTGRELYDLNNAYRLRIPAGSDIWETCRALENLPGVLSATPNPRAAELPTPGSFVDWQVYLLPTTGSPFGVDALYAWTRCGGDGEGVAVCDIEKGWNYDHQDISKAAGSQIRALCYPDPDWGDHGTAVLGILASDDNGWGTTGICHGADLMTCCEMWIDPSGAAHYDPAGAIVAAANDLSPGDVILLEMQWSYWGGEDRYAPIEWCPRTDPQSQGLTLIYAAIENAIANGIAVVEAAGNGRPGSNLDLLQWHGDSGAIIVGSANSDGTYRLTSSNFGARVNVQAPGVDVFTTGYGDFYDSEGENLYYTHTFGGTSSASAIVAGAVTCCLGYSVASGRTSPLPVLALRDVLVASGRPQQIDPTGSPEPIGPLPDLRAAFALLGDFDIFVTPNGERDYPTIQSAVDHAQDGDVIGLTSGTYTGDGNRDIDFHGRPLTVCSVLGNPAKCIIDCQGSPSNPRCGFVFVSGEDHATQVRDVTVRGGYAVNGGAILIDDSSPAIVGCVFEGNTACLGAGIYCGAESAPLLFECTFSNNELRVCTGGGGMGLCCEDASPVVQRCTFTELGAGGYGSAILCIHSTAVLEHCGIYLNAGSHGVIACRGSSASTLAHCTVAGNIGTGVGGGPYSILYLEDSNLTLTNTLIYSNVNPSAYLFECVGSAVPVLECCDVYGNEQGDWVGCIAGQAGMAGNMYADPLVCDLSHYPGGWPLPPLYSVHVSSPCLPGNNPACGGIGAYGVGCPASDVEPVLELPAAQRILVVFPNPFSQGTWVRYDAAGGQAGGRVTLEILDVTGRLVRTLTSSAATPDRGIVYWDGTDLGNRAVQGGIYLVRVVEDSRSTCGRMLLIR